MSRRLKSFSESSRERTKPNDPRLPLAHRQPSLAIDAVWGRGGAARSRLTPEPRPSSVWDLARRVVEVPGSLLAFARHRQPRRVANGANGRASALSGDRPDERALLAHDVRA